MSITRRDRRVITFYSYKGGVGRTMALANVAFRLADMHALDVVVVDWDLEAPGLHEFFDVSPARLAESRGVLDYFIEWREAAKRKDPKPPDAREWLIPIENTPRSPRHGSLRLLTAARVNQGYDARLSEFDWKDFYANASGALAVETLRKQLVESADVVLIDSRTGLTDAGGICTIQVPDGVVLMTTPNRQSLQGIEKIARSIAKAGARDRAGRQRATSWLTVCRMPSAEDAPLADEWIKLHTPQFKQMIDEGVLDREEHPYGLSTYLIPQRARWGFDEVLFTEHTGASPSDSLIASYKHLAVTVLDWVVGPFDLMAGEGFSQQEQQPSVDVLEKRAAAAEARRDIHGQLAALVWLGDVYDAGEKHTEALRVFERAGDIALGAELTEYQAAIKLRLARALTALDRTGEALNAAQTALKLAGEFASPSLQAQALILIGFLTLERDGDESAAPYFTRAVVASSLSGEADRALRILRAVASRGKAVEADRQLTKIIEHKRTSEQVYLSACRKVVEEIRKTGATSSELIAVETLLELTLREGDTLDIEELHARMDALRASGTGGYVAPRSATTNEGTARPKRDGAASKTRR